MDKKIISLDNKVNDDEKKQLVSQHNQNRSYILELNESGQPNLKLTEHLTMQNNSFLIIKLFNGPEITNNIFIITNLPNYLTSKELDIETLNPVHGKINGKFVKKLPDCVDTSVYFYFDVKSSGSFFFQVGYTNSKNEIQYTKEFWIVVDPIITVGNKEIPINSITMQTVLSKAIGKLEDWEKYFHEASLLSKILNILNMLNITYITYITNVTNILNITYL